MGLTGKGFGVPSQAVNITTGHQGDIFLKSLSLLSVFMLPRVGAVKHVGKSRRFCRKRLLEINGSWQAYHDLAKEKQRASAGRSYHLLIKD